MGNTDPATTQTTTTDTGIVAEPCSCHKNKGLKMAGTIALVVALAFLGCLAAIKLAPKMKV